MTDHRNHEAVLFNPRLTGHYRDWWRLLASQLKRMTDVNAALAAVEAARQSVSEEPSMVDPEGRLRFCATLSILRDLFDHGWVPEEGVAGLYLRPPTMSGADAMEQKALLRRAFGVARRAALQNLGTIDFIRDMERPRPWRGQEVSVINLIADGAELADALRGVLSLPDQEQELRLKEIIQPYLQIVPSSDRPLHEQRDEWTGLRLRDVWRYFRLTWATPEESTPGRNLFYLVRDAARPLHPVIGIAALGNVVPQVSRRDDYIGWSPKAVNKTFERRERWVYRPVALRGPGGTVQQVSTWQVIAAETDAEYHERTRVAAQELAQLMYDAALATLAEFYIDDLELTENEVTHPTDATLSRLSRMELEAEHLLRRAQEERKLRRPPSPIWMR